MQDLEYNAGEEQIAMPSWVTRPSLLMQALIGSSFVLLWFSADAVTLQLLSIDGVRAWYLPAGLGAALCWALGLRYAWAVVLAAWLGMLAVWQMTVPEALVVGGVQAGGAVGTAWLLRQSVPPGRLPRRPVEIGTVIASILVGAAVTGMAGVAALYVLGGLSGATASELVVAWVVADTLGMLAITPWMVMVAAPWLCYKVCTHSDEAKTRFVQALGALQLERSFAAWALMLSVAVSLAILVCLPDRCDPRVYYMGFIALPALAMRYRLAGGLTVMALTCAAGMLAVGIKRTDAAAMADLQLILIALSICTILVGSFAVMRSWAEQQRQAEHRWATLAMRGSGMGRWNWEVGTDAYHTDLVLTEAFGYRRDKVAPLLSWWEQRIHPEDVLLNRREMARLISGQSDYFEVENRMRAADGSWGWVHSQGTVIERDAQGKPKRIAGTHHDITEQKELERIRAESEATHRSEQRFRTLAGGAPVAIFQTDAKGEFLYVNPAWCEMTGQEANEALYHRASDFAHPDDQQEVSRHWAEAIRTKSAVGIEHRVVGTDGTTLWLQTQATPMIHNGVMLGYVGTGVDVTPYREAMSMIRDSEARYRTLADHAYDMLWRTGANGEFTYVSPSITKLLGYEPTQVVGTNALGYFHPEDQDRVREEHAAMSPDTPEFHDVHRYRRADGTYIVFETVGRLVVPEQADQQPYITGISRDVTQRVENEQIRRELEEKLARSQKLDAIGTFATGIAHDFRNSLLAINLSAQSAAKKIDPDHPAQPALGTVEDAVAQAMAVTQSLLTFARGQGAAKRPTDLAQLVRDNARLLEAVVPPGVDLAQTCPEQPVMVKANASELQQALLNLVMNAKDAIEGTGRIAVSLVRKDDSAVLTVRDNGSGMPREVMDRALEPFYTTKARLKGTGLGLSQVHGIVTDHGGEISLDSAPGIGTTITITLPIITEPTNTPTPQTEASTP